LPGRGTVRGGVLLFERKAGQIQRGRSGKEGTPTQAMEMMGGEIRSGGATLLGGGGGGDLGKTQKGGRGEVFFSEGTCG